MQIEHLLSKHKILSHFKITKSFPKKQLNEYEIFLRKKYKRESTIKKKLDEFILKNFNNKKSVDNIPGIIDSNKPIKKQTKQSESLLLRDFKSLSSSHQKLILNLSETIVKHSKKNKLSILGIFFLFQFVFNKLNIDNQSMQKISNRYKNKENISDDFDEYIDFDQDDDYDDDEPQEY